VSVSGNPGGGNDSHYARVRTRSDKGGPNPTMPLLASRLCSNWRKASARRATIDVILEAAEVEFIDEERRGPGPSQAIIGKVSKMTRTVADRVLPRRTAAR
jgi:hypothetical protein